MQIDGGAPRGDLIPEARASEAAQLLPILVIKGGRSGSSLLMELLGGDIRCEFDKVYPYEARYLGWFAKTAALMDGWRFWEHQDVSPLEDPVLDMVPTAWRDAGADCNLIGLPHGASVLRVLWGQLCTAARTKNPHAEFYAEKTSFWTLAYLRTIIDNVAVYLFRDPRDRFLSARAFVSQQGRFTWEARPGDTPLDYALRMARIVLELHENYKSEEDTARGCLIRYEDLVSDPETALQSLSRVTGIQPAPCSSYDNYARHRTSPDVASSIGRWKREGLEPEVRRCLEWLLADTMIDLGYELESTANYGRPSLLLHGSGEARAPFDAAADGFISNITARGAQVQVTGPCYHLHLPFEPFEAAQVSELWVCISAELGSFGAVYWRDRTGTFDDSRCLQAFYDPADQYRILRFKLKEHPHWAGRIHQLQLNLFNGKGWNRSGKTGHVRWIRLLPSSF